MNTKLSCLLPLVVAVFCGIVGCQSSRSVMGPEVEAAGEAIQIFRGMPTAELLAAMDEPVAVEQADPAREGHEIWVYRKRQTNVMSRVTGMKEIPYFDPITGQYRPVKEPVFSNESTVFKQEIRFHIADGVVLDWKVEQSRERDYH